MTTALSRLAQPRDARLAAPSVCRFPPALEAHGITIHRGPKVVLRNVDLFIHRGEIVALYGPNGAGKTTLLHCLAGVLRPVRGAVLLLGHPATRRPDARRAVGFVGHEHGLYGALTARANLVFAGRMYGLRRPEERAVALLASAGLARQAAQRVDRLSRGMRQRLAIVRAIVHQPPILLLDEPSTSLDAASRAWLADVLNEFRNRGGAVVLATHETDARECLATRRLHLSGSSLQAMPLPTRAAAEQLSLETGARAVEREPRPVRLASAHAGQSDFARCNQMQEGGHDKPRPLPESPFATVALQAVGAASLPGWSRLRAFGWLVAKDLAAEVHGRRVWPSMLLLGLTLVLLIEMQIELPAAQKAQVVSGMLWLGVVFAGALALERSFVAEREEGCWRALLLLPIPLTVVYLAKVAVNVLALAVLECLLIGAFTVLSNVPLANHGLELAGIALLANVGLVSVGVLVSAATSTVAARSGLLSLVLLPLATPVVIAAAAATRLAVTGALVAHGRLWIELLAVAALAFTTLGVMVFDCAMEE